MPEPTEIITIQTILNAQGVVLTPERLAQLRGAVDAHRSEAALLRSALMTSDEPADIFVPLRHDAGRGEA
jgi:hypothetical protein